MVNGCKSLHFVSGSIDCELSRMLVATPSYIPGADSVKFLARMGG